MTQAIPVAVRIRLFFIGKIRFLPVADVEQIAEETDLFPLNTVTHERRGRDIQELAQQVQ